MLDEFLSCDIEGLQQHPPGESVGSDVIDECLLHLAVEFDRLVDGCRALDVFLGWIGISASSSARTSIPWVHG